MSGLLSPSLRKEFRALAPSWLACLVALGAALAYGGGVALGLALPAYFIGAVALGALSVGHEYSHRTIGLLLSHPAPRQRLFFEKQAVLGALLLVLFAVAAILMRDTDGLRDAGARASERAAMVWLPMLCGLFVAPWLTMLCRDPIAGTVFSLAAPGVLLLMGEVGGALAYGSRAASTDFRMLLLWVGMPALCGIASVSSVRVFRNLEAVDGRGEDVRVPGWLRRRVAVAATPARRQHPVRLLVQKELRLQQLPMTVAALYLVAWVVVISVRTVFPDVAGMFNVLTTFYSGSVALLIGSVACAEERQMGTLQWQVLLPMSASRQWAVKVGVVLGLTLVVALAIPSLLAGTMELLPAGAAHGPFSRVGLAIPAIVLTITGLYVSSLCNTGLSALLMSIPVVLGAGLLVRGMEGPLLGAAFTLSDSLPRSIIPAGLGLMGIVPVLTAVLAAGCLALALRLGLANYRSAERAPGRTSKQAIALAGCIALSVAITAAATALEFASMVLHRR